MIHSKSRKNLNQFFFLLCFFKPSDWRDKKQNRGEKNCKQGFTLIEVMLAMMIAALTFAPVFMTYSMILRRVGTSSRAYDYIILCKNFLNEARQKQEPDAQDFSLEKKELDADATLTYSLSKTIPETSVLKSLQGLHRELVTISWQENGQKKEEQLVAFVYKKPEQKK